MQAEVVKVLDGGFVKKVNAGAQTWTREQMVRKMVRKQAFLNKMRVKTRRKTINREKNKIRTT